MDQQRGQPDTAGFGGIGTVVMFRGLGPLTELDNDLPFPLWAEVGFFLSPTMATSPAFPKPIATHEMWVDARIEVEDGRPLLTHLSFRRVPSRGPITAAVVRGLNVARFTEMARRSVANFVNLRPDDRGRVALTDEVRDIWQRAEGAGRRRVITDTLLHQVANIYRANGTGAPTVAVAEQLYTSHRNATRWVALARERGFLPPYNEDD